MDALPGLVTAMGAAYLGALAAWPGLGLSPAPRALALAAAATPIVASTAIVPAGATPLRAIMAFLAVDLLLKVVDAARAANRLTQLGNYCRFLLPFPLLAVVWGMARRRRGPRPWGVELAAAACQLAILSAVAAVFLLQRQTAWLRTSFLLDHTLKVGLLAIVIESFSRLQTALERLVGLEVPPLSNRAVLSVTPAEFWRRYNTRVHAWLEIHVFRSPALRRAPALAVWSTFLLSGLGHEVFVGIASSRADGYQLAFFLLQAPAVLASGALQGFADRHGTAGRVIARTVTVLWLATTSILFLHGPDRVLPFIYESTPWLP